MRTNRIDWKKLSGALGIELDNFTDLRAYACGELRHSIDQDGTAGVRQPDAITPLLPPSSDLPTLQPLANGNSYTLFNSIILAASDLRASLIYFLPAPVRIGLGLYSLADTHDALVLSDASKELLATILEEIPHYQHDKTVAMNGNNYNTFEEKLSRAIYSSLSIPNFNSQDNYLLLRLIYIVDTYLYCFGRLTAHVSRHTIALPTRVL